MLLTWGPQIIDYVRQHPWRVFAAVLVFVLLMDLMFRKRSSRGGDGGDFSGLDFGGDGDCGGG
ncbi:hypothetical protein FFI89_011595 [Bradyrhizobium sp. KBS0727]|uniref:hypothetical protein n=1 Tax=unclassified Bradyrhizobium TaxID=2631580 RepID=UPI00110F0F98|nr:MULTISPECIES: hypothetical protein [unclassified Bradyrhizobium]QDW37740.1 hypothetical protein FFI71_011590 [Bradyrhizobium sp. KBS0725]QDW44344.1 hypothetical protein FFI89_011595 [Bradyrhizobium sp. KBS0727]